VTQSSYSGAKKVVKKTHLFLKDDNAGGPVDLDGVRWKFVCLPAGVLGADGATDGDGGADGTLFLQALILQPLQQGRW